MASLIGTIKEAPRGPDFRVAGACVDVSLMRVHPPGLALPVLLSSTYFALRLRVCAFARLWLSLPAYSHIVERERMNGSR